jgi:hypothetical protein
MILSAVFVLALEGIFVTGSETKLALRVSVDHLKRDVITSAGWALNAHHQDALTAPKPAANHSVLSL